MSYNLEQYTYNALKRMNLNVDFAGYADILNFKGLELMRMLATRSFFLRGASTTFWLRKINEVYLRKSTIICP